MKAKEYINLISFILGLIALLIQSYVSVKMILAIKEILESSQGDINPMMVSGGIKMLVMLALPITISLLLGIMGIIKTDNYKGFSKLGITFSLLALFLAVVPFIYLFMI